MTSKPRFPTILSARGNDGRPSDLEFLLRSHCQKLRVVEKLSGAHLMFPSESMAIRAYFAYDLSSAWTNDVKKNNDDFDNLQGFFKTFKTAVVVFILSEPQQQQKQLSDPNSCFHRTQRLVRAITLSDNPKTTDKVARVFLVPSPESAISSLTSLADTIKRWDVKQSYYEKQREFYYLPNPSSNSIPRTSAPAAARHVAAALRGWAHRFDIHHGNENVLMSLLGTLGMIAEADDSALSSIPIDDRTKHLVQAFFGSGSSSTGGGGGGGGGAAPASVSRGVDGNDHGATFRCGGGSRNSMLTNNHQNAIELPHCANKNTTMVHRAPSSSTVLAVPGGEVYSSPSACSPLAAYDNSTARFMAGNQQSNSTGPLPGSYFFQLQHEVAAEAGDMGMTNAPPISALSADGGQGSYRGVRPTMAPHSNHSVYFSPSDEYGCSSMIPPSQQQDYYNHQYPAYETGMREETMPDSRYIVQPPQLNHHYQAVPRSGAPNGRGPRHDGHAQETSRAAGGGEQAVYSSSTAGRRHNAELRNPYNNNMSA